MAKNITLSGGPVVTDTTNNSASGNIDAQTVKSETLPITFNSHVNAELAVGATAIPFYPAGIAASTRLEFEGRVFYGDAEPTSTRQITMTIDTNTYIFGHRVSFVTTGAAVIASVQNTITANIIGEWFIVNKT